MRRTSQRVRDVRGENQPELPLGHPTVDWNVLPAAVRADVLTRWCELLPAVAVMTEDSAVQSDGGVGAEDRS